jgi:Lon protease-like protein
MAINTPYRAPAELPEVLPVFPLPGALLLPRGQMPLNIFEPRYLAMTEDAIKGARIIGVVQPDPDTSARSRRAPGLFSVGCAGRITEFAESGDGRVLITLTGVARFRIVQELSVLTPYRQCGVDFHDFAHDFEPRWGEEAVPRQAVITALRDFVKANNLRIDWKGINEAPNEALVNALSMMSPFGPKEKQALLEASDLKSRAEMLIAITEIELARGENGSDTPLQ